MARNTSGSTTMTKRVSSIILHGVFLLVTLVWIYPLIWAITSSLKVNRELYSGTLNPLPEEFQWSYLLPSQWSSLAAAFEFDNYSRAWEIANFSTYFLNTVIFSVAVVAIVVSLTCMTGYVLGRYSFPGRLFIIGAIAATTFIPTGYTIIPLWQLINALGLGSSLLGVILAEAGGAHVLYILLFAGYFAALPKELSEAAEIDGSSFVNTFIRIMLPLAMPVVATATVLQLIRAWNSYFIPLVFTIHRPDLRTLGVGMTAFVGAHSSDTAGMAAAATISLVPIILVFLFFQRYFVEGIAGAVKS